VARLLDDELAKGREGVPTKRADFLGRYARVVHHHDLVKPVDHPQTEPLQPVKAKTTRPKSAPLVQEIQATPMPREKSSGPLALTTGFQVSGGERTNVGFAELLFRGTSETAPVSGPDWAKTAVDAPPTIHANEALLPPDDFVPFWLRASVFIGGSMIIGGILAHLSGDASWQKKPQAPSLKPASVEARAEPGVPKAVPLLKATSVPSAVSLPEPQATPPPAVQDSGSSLLKAPQSTLKEQIIGLPPPAR
jgi:hypothetical protein